MNDYITKLVIGSFCMICFAGILAGGRRSAIPIRNYKPLVPEVTYVRDKNGNIVGAASSVPYSTHGIIEQRPVDTSILKERLNGTDNEFNKKVSD